MTMSYSFTFAGGRAAAQARLAGVRPGAYARTRNALDGAVTRLSPYLTHGVLALPQVLRALTAAGALPVGHKLVYELGWRAYFRHVWAHRGDGILRSLHPGPLPDDAYTDELPDDLRQARTGVPAVDEAVRTLYDTGYLHNHARMWLASYTVHLRKVHWRAGADWMLPHLLDGDLASNHLSWQWVAGTGSHKPYLFNAGNVKRYAPPHWHSDGSVLDTGYDALDVLARSPSAVPGGAAGPAAPEPPCLRSPPPALGFGAPDEALTRGREVWLVHPWALHGPPAALPAHTLVLAVAFEDLHAQRPWSARRWRFVGECLDELTPHRWLVDAGSLAAALRTASAVHARDDPHVSSRLPPAAVRHPAALAFPRVDRRCDSFSRWWARATDGLHDTDQLLSGTDHE
jgi:deoxyribodipyrimidine photo-lyase